MARSEDVLCGILRCRMEAEVDPEGVDPGSRELGSEGLGPGS